jgi:excisionase family DNA binding protein
MATSGLSAEEISPKLSDGFVLDGRRGMTSKETERMLLTVRDVAKLTGFSVGTLYHFVSQRRIPVVRISSRCIRFRRSDLEQWISTLVDNKN